MAALREIKILKSDCWNGDFDIPAVGEELFQLDESLWVNRLSLVVLFTIQMDLIVIIIAIQNNAISNR